MVTVRTCAFLPDAQMIRSYLEGSDIRVVLPDEFTIQTNWLWSNAMGGIRVQVSEEDETRARDLLKNFDQTEAEAKKQCPQCGAVLKETDGWDLLWKVPLILFLSIPFRSRSVWQCPSCGTRIKSTK